MVDNHIHSSAEVEEKVKKLLFHIVERLEWKRYFPICCCCPFISIGGTFLRWLLLHAVLYLPVRNTLLRLLKNTDLLRDYTWPVSSDIAFVIRGVGRAMIRFRKICCSYCCWIFIHIIKRAFREKYSQCRTRTIWACGRLLLFHRYSSVEGFGNWAGGLETAGGCGWPSICFGNRGGRSG